MEAVLQRETKPAVCLSSDIRSSGIDERQRVVHVLVGSLRKYTAQLHEPIQALVHIIQLKPQHHESAESHVRELL